MIFIIVSLQLNVYVFVIRDKRFSNMSETVVYRLVADVFVLHTQVTGDTLHNKACQ